MFGFSDVFDTLKLQLVKLLNLAVSVMVDLIPASDHQSDQAFLICHMFLKQMQGADPESQKTSE